MAWTRRLVAVSAVSLIAAAGAQEDDAIWLDGQLIEPEFEEAMLWMQSDSLERWLVEDSGMLYDDRELEEYLTRIARALMHESIGTDAPNLRVHVLLNADFNAFALPNGALFVHTGILAQMDNEAQLGILLGHELTHSHWRLLLPKSSTPLAASC